MSETITVAELNATHIGKAVTIKTGRIDDHTGVLFEVHHDAVSVEHSTLSGGTVRRVVRTSHTVTIGQLRGDVDGKSAVEVHE